MIHLFLHLFWWLFQWDFRWFTFFFTFFGDFSSDEFCNSLHSSPFLVTFLSPFLSLWYFPFFLPFLAIFSVTFSATLQIHHYFWCFSCHLFRPSIFSPFLFSISWWFFWWQIILSNTSFGVIVALFAWQCKRVQDFFFFNFATFSHSSTQVFISCLFGCAPSYYVLTVILTFSYSCDVRKDWKQLQIYFVK